MQYSIRNAPHFATLDFALEEDEEISAEPDLLLAMSPNIEITAKVPNPSAPRWWGSARSGSLVGESLFTAKYRAKETKGFLSLAPRLPGDILSLRSSAKESYYLSQGSFLACTSNISLTYRRPGLRGVLSRAGLYVLEVDGDGEVFCSSYGAITAKKLDEDESLIIDNRFVIAFSEGIQFHLVKASKDLAGSIYPGGGLVNQYTGPGTVYYQSRANPLVD